jgi:hypothetical protein
MSGLEVDSQSGAGMSRRGQLVQFLKPEPEVRLQVPKPVHVGFPIAFEVDVGGHTTLEDCPPLAAVMLAVHVEI